MAYCGLPRGGGSPGLAQLLFLHVFYILMDGVVKP